MTGWFGSEPSTERYTIPIGCCIYYHHYYYYLLCLAATLSLSLAALLLPPPHTPPFHLCMGGGNEQLSDRYNSTQNTLLYSSTANLNNI